MSEPLSVEDAGKHPLQRSVRAPGTLGYLACYILIGVASLLIIEQVVVTGFWLKLGTPVLLIWFGIFGLVILRNKERSAQPVE